MNFAGIPQYVAIIDVESLQIDPAFNFTSLRQGASHPVKSLTISNYETWSCAISHSMNGRSSKIVCRDGPGNRLRSKGEIPPSFCAKNSTAPSSAYGYSWRLASVALDHSCDATQFLLTTINQIDSLLLQSPFGFNRHVTTSTFSVLGCFRALPSPTIVT
jgi:hypothetical protein